MFDDGFSNVYEEALPLLEGFGFKANVALIGSKINKRGYLTEEQIRQLLLKGWDLSDHSYSHMDFGTASAEEVNMEIVRNQRLVSRLFNYKLDNFVFPKSRLSANNVSIVLSHYPIAFTGTKEIESNVLAFGFRLLKRVELSNYEVIYYGLRFSLFKRKIKQYLKDLEIQKRKEWLILFTHRVRNIPSPFDLRRKDFRNILDDIHSHIPTVTTTEGMRLLANDHATSQ
jgi:peptidoglycan/xylan/chitin deacetylase (PgdA/CDA1 family)